MKNIIIVTGGAGFVGSNLIELLIKNTKFSILSIDNYSTCKRQNYILSKRLIYIKSDTNNISKISVVGVGMRSHAGVAQKLFDTLGKNKINIQVITTSEIKISILIDEKYTELAVQKLHQAFKLHK